MIPAVSGLLLCGVVYFRGGSPLRALTRVTQHARATVKVAGVMARAAWDKRSRYSECLEEVRREW